MKTINQMKPLARLIATSLAVGSIAGFGAQVFAQTAAGTLIKNLATVTYEDENGNEYSAQSNEAIVTVAPVYSAVIEKDNALSAAPGQTVYFPHVLSNTGNITDSYKLATSGVTAGSSVKVYHDLNANGQPDPGEPELSATDEIEIAAGEQKSVVVAMAVPVDAVDTATYSSTLTATTDNATVIDENDNADGNNVDTATVSTGPILVLNKSSVHDAANNQVTYTLTVKNNGGSDATNVNIIDALPEVDHDNDSGTADVQVSFVSASSNGLVNVGDIDAAEQTVDENNVGEINGNTTTETSLQAIVAKDVTLPPNTTISVTYTVSYTAGWAAGASVDNTFVAFDDPDNNGNPDNSTTGVVSSNTTHDVIPNVYDVDAKDTNADEANGVNDGGDDDTTADPNNDSQYVDVSPTGGEVLYKHIITNEGNGDDVFNLSVAAGNFPTNTIFTFWDATGTVQLTDSDNDGVPDTGTIGAGDALTVMVKAKLPAGVSGTNYAAVLTATSSGDSTVKDTTGLALGEITAPKVDIANDSADQGDTGFGDNGVENAQNESPAKLVDAELGGVAVFELKLANESGSADSYLLSAGNVPTGWDVKFKDAAGNVITTTPLIPGGDTYSYKAEVTVSADPTEAKHDSDRAGDADGYDSSNTDTTNSLVAGTIDAGTDGDKDYQISFNAASTSTPGLLDTVTNSVDVTPDREVVITPNGQNQIQPGGTVDYSHKIENNGNMDEPVEVSVTNTLAGDGWTSVIKVDTTGNGIPDSVLSPGTATIKGRLPNGSFVDIPVTYVGGNAQMTIPPGVDVDIISVVNAPSNAALGAVDTSTISVADNSGSPTPSPTVTAQDQTSVILGQVRLDKQAAIDEGCNGSLETTFSANQSSQVKPGDCVVWRLTATNEGNANVKNVVVSDAAPDYTAIVPNMLKLCLGNTAACDATPLTDTATDTDDLSVDGGAVSGDIVTFQPWSGGSVVELQPGQKVTAEFTVKID